MEAAIAKALQQTEAAMQPGASPGASLVAAVVVFFRKASLQSPYFAEDVFGGASSSEDEDGEEPGGGSSLEASDGELGDGTDEEQSLGEDDLGDIDADLDGEEGGQEDAGAEADSEPEAKEGGSGSSGDEGEGGSAGMQQPGVEADAFAKAFSKIMERAGKAGQEESAAAEAPILMGSKSIAKRKARDAEAAQHDKEAKRLRLEMKQRGHVVPTKRGEDPASDAREKSLQRLATRGVVRLFNAIAKAQKQLRDAAEQTGNKAKAAKLGRASFLAELKGAGASAGAAGAAAREGALIPSAAPGQAAAAAGQRGQRTQLAQRGPAGGQSSSSEDDGENAGWEVLQKGFAGLQGGNKMKDWDRQQDSDESPGEALDEEDSEGDGL
ncbi:hypothetical protein N2152v2_005058 [Parachlorella kessleri]